MSTATERGAGVAPPPAPAWFDATDQAFIDEPSPALLRARQEVGAPIMRLREFGGIDCVLSYEGVKAILHDPETFSNAAVQFPEGDRVPSVYADRVPKGGFNKQLMVATDPPGQTAVRKIANKGFRRPRLEDLADQIRGQCVDLIGEFAGNGEGDLMTSFCLPLALRMLAALMGLPNSDVPLLRQIGMDLIPFFNNRTPQDEAEWTAAWGRWLDVRDYFGDLVRERAEQPGDDIISIFAAELGSDGAPTVDHIVTQLSGIVTAGADSTANLLAHGIRLMTGHPDQLEACTGDPGLWTNAVEEVFRYRTTFMMIHRGLMRDAEVCGYPLTRGTKIQLSLAAANWDPEKFPEPDRFDVRRDNAGEHLGLGRGRHFCLGAPLTRIEVRIGLHELFERLKDVRISDEPRRYTNTGAAGGSLVKMQASWKSSDRSAALVRNTSW